MATVSQGIGAAPDLAIRELESELIVATREDAAEGVVALVLQSGDGADLAGWTPGAHIDLVLGEGLARQYSLCGDPATADAWRIGVLRDPASRGGSQFVHDRLREGHTVRVRGPRNHFPLVASPRYLFIAGGIGITPVLPMIDAAAGAGADWRLLYGGRTRSSMAFLDELAAYGERVEVHPQDEDGLLDLESALSVPQPDTLVYCCGPEPLLDAVTTACADWPPGSLHLERFAAKSVAEPATAGLDTFEVVCQRSGVTVTVPQEKTIYESVEEAGVDVLGSCLEGICGTCEAVVLEGKPDHRDSVLSEAERDEAGVMMICVSRSCSVKLVLDI